VIAQTSWQAVVLAGAKCQAAPILALPTITSLIPRFLGKRADHRASRTPGCTERPDLSLRDVGERRFGKGNRGRYHGAGFSAEIHAGVGRPPRCEPCQLSVCPKLDGKVAGVAPAGEAWRRAWDDGLANPDPFESSPSSLPLLWYGINAVNDPPITNPDYHHPCPYGANLSGLVLFVQMTRADVRRLGKSEQEAAELGMPGELASQLQREAWLAVKRPPLTSGRYYRQSVRPGGHRRVTASVFSSLSL
jgi:hypothetical protein